MLSVFLIGPFAQSERTAIGLDGKPPEQKTNDEQTNPVDANAPKITQTDYFGAEGSDERNKEVREFTELYQKFANNPKIKKNRLLAAAKARKKDTLVEEIDLNHYF